MKTPSTLTPQDRRLLAARALMPERTVRRAYSGESCKPTTLARLECAAAELKLPPPPRQGAHAAA
jgi:hypothetical protein